MSPSGPGTATVAAKPRSSGDDRRASTTGTTTTVDRALKREIAQSRKLAERRRNPLALRAGGAGRLKLLTTHFISFDHSFGTGCSRGRVCKTSKHKTPHNLCRFNLFCNERIVAVLCKIFVKLRLMPSRWETIIRACDVYISIRSIIQRTASPPSARKCRTHIASPQFFQGRGNENQNVVRCCRDCIHIEQRDRLRVERSHNRHEPEDIIA